MICASVPLSQVSSHLDATLGVDDNAPPSRRERSIFAFEIERNDVAEPVFLLTSARRTG